MPKGNTMTSPSIYKIQKEKRAQSDFRSWCEDCGQVEVHFKHTAVKLNDSRGKDKLQEASAMYTHKAIHKNGLPPAYTTVAPFFFSESFSYSLSHSIRFKDMT